MSNVKVIENFETFLESTNMPSYDQRFKSYGHWKLEEASVLDRSGYLVKFIVGAYFQWGTGGAMDTRVLENFITFLMMGRTQNSDLGRRNYDRLKLNGLVRYDFFSFFYFGLISSFFWFVSKVHLIHTNAYATSCNMSVISVPHQKKSFAKYIWRMYSWWQSHYPRSQF
jgi:hypothetical protein